MAACFTYPESACVLLVVPVLSRAFPPGATCNHSYSDYLVEWYGASNNPGFLVDLTYCGASYSYDFCAQVSCTVNIRAHLC